MSSQLASPFLCRALAAASRRRPLSSSSSSSSSTPPPELLSLLVCPLTKEPLRLDTTSVPGAPRLVSEGINVAYGIHPSTGLVNLIPSEATILDMEEKGGEGK